MKLKFLLGAFLAICVGATGNWPAKAVTLEELQNAARTAQVTGQPPVVVLASGSNPSAGVLAFLNSDPTILQAIIQFNPSLTGLSTTFLDSIPASNILTLTVTAANNSAPGRNPTPTTGANLASQISELQQAAFLTQYAPTTGIDPSITLPPLGAPLSLQIVNIQQVVSGFESGSITPIKNIAPKIIRLRNALMGSTSTTLVADAPILITPPASGTGITLSTLVNYHGNTAVNLPDCASQILTFCLNVALFLNAHPNAAWNFPGGGTVPITTLAQAIQAMPL